MNIDVTVAHRENLAGADEAFIYEDLDRECDSIALVAEVYKDVAVDYAGFLTEIHEVSGPMTKVLVRLTRMDRAGVVPMEDAVPA